MQGLTILHFLHGILPLLGRFDRIQLVQTKQLFNCLFLQGPFQNHTPNVYIPCFTIIEFIGYLGWIKVAETLLNPWGDDDEDFQINYLIDRNFQVWIILQKFLVRVRTFFQGQIALYKGVLRLAIKHQSLALRAIPRLNWLWPISKWHLIESLNLKLWVSFKVMPANFNPGPKNVLITNEHLMSQY